MNTFQSLSLSALLAASIAGSPAVAQDISGTFVAGALTRNSAITTPVGAQDQGFPTHTAAIQRAAPERLYGGFMRGADGLVTPIDASATHAQGVPARFLPAAASSEPADTRLFGSFVRVNGIAVPADLSRPATATDRNPSDRTVAARLAR